MVRNLILVVPHLLLASTSWLARHSTVTGWYLAMVLASSAMQLFTGVAQSSQTAALAANARKIRSCSSFSSGMCQLLPSAARTCGALRPMPMEATTPKPAAAVNCLMKSRRVDMVLHPLFFMMDTRRSTPFAASGKALHGVLLLPATGGCNAVLLLPAATALTSGFAATRTCCYLRAAARYRLTAPMARQLATRNGRRLTGRR